MVIRGSNIFGNGEAGLGCGLINESGVVIDARNNYWGKSTGPGPNPGDRVYGDCQVSGTTLTAPFATVPLPIEEDVNVYERQ